VCCDCRCTANGTVTVCCDCQCTANGTVTVCCDCRCTRNETAVQSATQRAKLFSYFLHILLIHEYTNAEISLKHRAKLVNIYIYIYIYMNCNVKWNGERIKIDEIKICVIFECEWNS